MAKRPVFIPTTSGHPPVDTAYVEFEWYPGMHINQKRKSIEALHAAARERLGLKEILEISTKSPDTLGISLSAFNLLICTLKHQQTFSVESAYQGSKVFEMGGPFVDLLSKPAREAKKDPRLRNSGRVIGFQFLGVNWQLEPRTAFYDWLYVNAVRKTPALGSKLSNYSAFTDIEFNPERSINCQAYSAALFVALNRRGLISESIATKEGFLRALGVNGNEFESRIPIQGSLGLDVESEEMLTNYSKNEDVSMAHFDAMTYQAWDILQGVKALVERWSPELYRTERDYEQALYEFLNEELPYVDIEKPAASNRIRADLVVADTVAVEVKSNLDSASKYQQLIDELSAMKKWTSGIVVLLLGRSDPKLVRALQSRVKSWKVGKGSGARVAVIRKTIGA